MTGIRDVKVCYGYTRRTEKYCSETVRVSLTKTVDTDDSDRLKENVAATVRLAREMANYQAWTTDAFAMQG